MARFIAIDKATEDFFNIRCDGCKCYPDEGGFGEVWMNDEVSWAYPLFFRMRRMLDDLQCRVNKVADSSRGRLQKRFLAQMARELVLFQASDWAFMIHNKSAAEYARARQNGHYENVCALYAAATASQLDSRLLEVLEKKNNLFPWIGELL